MKKSITISIPEPCHEDWGKMTATEKGRFCKVCTKEVIDFTDTSDETLIKRFQKGDNLCGRFKPSQLNRKMTLERKSRNGFLPYAASFLLPLSIMGHQNTHANPSVFNKPSSSINIGVLSEKSIVTITGQVTDEWGNPLFNVEVLAIETGKSVYTDLDGNYTLKCPSGSTLSFLHEEKLPYEVTVGNQNSIIHAFLKGAPNEIEIPILHVMGKIAPQVMIEGEIEVIEEIDEAKDIVINGTVKDQDGYELPGVQVKIQGTEIVTSTDFDGHYEIKAKANQILEFSYLAHETQKITLSNIDNTFDVTLKFKEEYFTLGIVLVDYNDSGNESHIESPLERNASWDDDQWENQRKRQEYAAKENAFKKVQQERQKEARKLKRARRHKK